MRRKVVIISGAPFNQRGAGKYLSSLSESIADRGFDVKYIVYNGTSKNIINFLHKIHIYALARVVYYFIQKTLHLFKTKGDVLKNANVMIFFPQSLSIEIIEKVFKEANHVFLYVLDNSFFCVKSYNNMKGNMKECLKCLDNSNFAKLNECETFPIRDDVDNMLTKMKKFHLHRDRLTFFAQNDNQNELLRRNYGDDISSYVVGMYPDDISINDIVNNVVESGFDVVFHASTHYAKGVDYFIELARCFPEYTFLLPYLSNVELDLIIKIMEIPENLSLKAIGWDSGLKSEVMRAKLVLCPSIWSASIEGALLKSMCYNGCVGVIKDINYSFSMELPPETLVRLSSEPSLNSLLFGEIIGNDITRNDIRKSSQTWLRDYLLCKSSNLDKMLNVFMDNYTESS